MVEFKVNPGEVKETIVKTTTYEPVEAPTVEGYATGEKTYTAKTIQEESVKVYGKGKIKVKKGKELLGRIGMAIAALQGEVKTYGGLPDETVEEAKSAVETYKGVKAAYDTVLKTGDKMEVVSEAVKKIDTTGLEEKVE